MKTSLLVFRCLTLRANPAKVEDFGDSSKHFGLARIHGEVSALRREARPLNPEKGKFSPPVPPNYHL
jgi:hypothetical protein